MARPPCPFTPFFLVPKPVFAGRRCALLALILAPALAGAQSLWKYRIEPDFVREGTEGEMVLVARSPWPCGTVFSQLAPFRIVGNSITLGFKADTAAGPNKYARRSDYAGCVDSAGNPAPYPAGPVFQFHVPDAQVQRYPVFAKWLDGCAGAGPDCVDSSAYPAGTLTVQSTNPFPPGFFVSPSDTFAGRPFTVTLWNRDWDCNTRVDSGFASVRDRIIDLYYRVRKAGSATCPVMGAPPVSVPIALPALAPGLYDVKPWGEPCPVNSTDCQGRPYGLPEFTLRIRDEGKPSPSEWYLREHWVKSDSALSLQVLNRRVHFCGSRFSRMSVEARDHRLYLRFDALSLGASACNEGPDPWGPLFSAPRLAEGVYPVFILPNAVCAGDSSGCAQSPSDPVADDTLVVSRYFTGLVTALRTRNPEARFLDGRLRMALPGPGTWLAELEDANGRREAAGRVTVDAGGEGHLDLPRAPGPGFRLLILRNAAGVTRLLPMAR